MSLILDALNRSRQDADQVPGLATQHYETLDSREPPAWRRALPWLALGVALLVIAWLLLGRGGEPTLQAPGPVPAAPAEREQVAGDPPVSDPVAGAPAAEAATENPPQAEPAPPTLPVAAVEPPPAAQAPAGEPAAGADEAVSALYERQVPGQPAPLPSAAAPDGTSAPAPTAGSSQRVRTVEEQPVDIEEMVARARDEMDNARLAEHPAPFITGLSQQTKDRIPTIFYQRHDYNGDSGRSVVVLNGKELRVGGRPAPGVKVEEILPDSVVLSHQGTEFRLRALNSWVNL